MIKECKVILLILFLFQAFLGQSQGCSDAGFCTMGAMKPSQDFKNNVPIKLRSISLGLYEGQSNTSANIRAVILDFGIMIGDRYDLQIKAPYMYVNGNFGSTQGIGDISLSLTRNIISKPQYNILATVGTKIPTNNATKTVAERSMVLPMYYQTSLGTYDFVAGASFLNRKWLFSFGYQQPLIHKNENNFIASEELWGWYEGGMDYVIRHDEGLSLKRGADIMMRFERNFRMSRLNFNLGLLPIYRITHDKALNEQDEYQIIDGTTGLALSGLVGISYKFNVLSGLDLIYGKSIVQREQNPDGLTRQYVLNLNYTYNF
ncbi:hypothetical protein [Marivirga arenosa]|uniref:Transporter n=1 Tax=Marivirga arenosa TaxID=3059076 RepID=A0AA49JCX7_9BACT|nr:hypothetical protein [Marivirga sp. BKB1-2]WKK80913.2 hypothetical protein QYS47_00370 [Marivirga sp. BKB1-2]